MIKTIIFDNGGVLVEDNWLKFITSIEDKYDKKPGSIAKNIKEHEYLATRGELSFKDLLAYINEITESKEDLFLLYNPSPIKPEMLSLLKELKEKGYELALLTNEISSFDHDNKTWHMERIFEKIFCSSKIGYGKPDKEIYEYVWNKLNRKPEETIFVDDRERNLEPARRLGVNVIKFNTVEQLKNDLAKLLK